MRNVFVRQRKAPKLSAVAKILAAITAVAAIIAGVLLRKAAAAKRALANNSGENYVDTAVKILMAVVIGALLLAGLYMLFGQTVLPTLVQRITDMFNYSG